MAFYKRICMILVQSKYDQFYLTCRFWSIIFKCILNLFTACVLILVYPACIFLPPPLIFILQGSDKNSFWDEICHSSKFSSSWYICYPAIKLSLNMTISIQPWIRSIPHGNHPQVFSDIHQNIFLFKLLINHKMVKSSLP